MDRKELKNIIGTIRDKQQGDRTPDESIVLYMAETMNRVYSAICNAEYHKAKEIIEGKHDDEESRYI